jgi:uroporphyrinogen-III synthase
MLVIVTRPAAQAAQWVKSLSDAGIAALALPLIDIAASPDPAAVEQAWRTLSRQRLVVFVSPNAAECFFAQRPPDAAWPDSVAAASIGPGTTQALRRLGVPAASIIEPAANAARFDSEALWARLAGRDWSGADVLIVRGDGGRDWLAETLKQHGAQVEFVRAYRRSAPRLTADALQCLADAVARPAEHLWFFSSSEAITHLVQLRPDQPWTASRAIATHPRIAQRARECGFGDVRETRPTLDAVVACIQSIAS